MTDARTKPARGFILAEALIALVVIGVVFLALEGSLSIVIRSLADSEREATATRLAESERERLFGSPCNADAGADSVNAVVVSWSASAADHLIRIDQAGRYPSRIGDRALGYVALGECQ
jgi:Tfp pilus assembly protein PilV